MPAPTLLTIAEVQLKLQVKIPPKDIEWIKEKNKKYTYHMTLHHIPTGMHIEQASERAWSEAKESCLMTLQWRLDNWDEYVKSRVRPLPINS